MIVAENIAEQIESGSRQIFGVMIESHLNEGAQKFTPGKDDPSKLEYGKSITDACINWEDSVNVLQGLALAVKNRRRLKK
jgi:3-deoxy-7-phosphoheptulonate synthase